MSLFVQHIFASTARHAVCLLQLQREKKQTQSSPPGKFKSLESKRKYLCDECCEGEAEQVGVGEEEPVGGEAPAKL